MGKRGVIIGICFGLFLLILNLGFASAININSCQSLNQPNTVYTLTQDITATAGTCFTDIASGVILDGQGHKVTEAAGGNGYGVDSNPSNGIGITIKNIQFSGFYSGLRLTAISNAQVSNVIIQSSSHDGIYDYPNGLNNTYTNITVIGSGVNGLEIQFGSRMTITGSTFSNNGWPSGGAGIMIYGTSNSYVYNNNLINNNYPTQIRVATAGDVSNNVYNLAAPIGGNYYSSYDAPAEGCNDLNGDGFCDAPLVFSTGQDNLPWTIQNGWALIQQAAPTTVGDSQTILLLSSQTNAHGALWNDTNYLIKVQYNTIFGSSYNGAGDPHACTGSNKVLRLSSITNAHAEEPSQNTAGYVDVCYGNLTCNYFSSVSVCPSGNLVVSISSRTNAHLAGDNSYGTAGGLICCSTSGAPPIAPAPSVSCGVGTKLCNDNSCAADCTSPVDHGGDSVNGCGNPSNSFKQDSCANGLICFSGLCQPASCPSGTTRCNDGTCQTNPLCPNNGGPFSQCSSARTSYTFLDPGNLGVSQSTMNGSACAGQDKVNGTIDDCCPSGWACSTSNVNPGCKLYNVTDTTAICSFYTNQGQSACQNDSRHLAPNEPAYSLYGCGTTLNATSNILCSCSWDYPTNTCALGKEIRSSVELTKVISSCVYGSVLGECSKGFQNVDITVLNSTGFDSTCKDSHENVPCLRSTIQLPFFGTMQFMLSAIAIALLYLIMFGVKTKKK